LFAASRNSSFVVRLPWHLLPASFLNLHRT
jgi:hypothetical protein